MYYHIYTTILAQGSSPSLSVPVILNHVKYFFHLFNRWMRLCCDYNNNYSTLIITMRMSLDKMWTVEWNVLTFGLWTWDSISDVTGGTVRTVTVLLLSSILYILNIMIFIRFWSSSFTCPGHVMSSLIRMRSSHACSFLSSQLLTIRELEAIE